MPPDSAKGIPHCIFSLAVTIMIHLFSDRPLVYCGEALEFECTASSMIIPHLYRPVAAGSNARPKTL
jgi:hypothetical protein